MIAFLRDNARWLLAAGLLMMSSSFGQTFFISLFAGEIRNEFGLSHGQWGGIYTVGTLASAALMLFAGGITDRFRVRHLSAIILVTLSAVCIAMAVVPGAWALPFVIFGLRFCGQGMLSHTAAVGLGRWFARNRGRANAFISIGYLTGESILPFLFVVLMGLIGWRMSWVVAAALALIFIPLLQMLLRAERKPGATVDIKEEPGMDSRHWNRRDAVSHWLFWIAALGVASPSMFVTAYFFQQVHLTEIKGWQLTQFVALIPLYSIASLGATFAFGALADRFGTARIFPVAMLPTALAFSLASMGETLWAAAAAFLFIGMMQGGVSTIGGAFWPEYYGTRNLGSIRAVASSLMVFGSAIGPGITGFLIDWGVDFRLQLLWMSVYFVGLACILTLGFERARRHLPSFGN